MNKNSNFYCPITEGHLIASMTNELRRYNIIVISIHPGWVRTDMGGSAAPVLPEESARGIINIAMNLMMKDTGKFLDYKGNTIPC